MLRFFALILIQVLILNNIQLGGYINPYLYILFILMLPLETPGWILLTFAFFLGVGVDLFTQTLGMHSAASVFMAWCRPWVLKTLSPREDYEFGTQPSVRDMGLAWYVSYSGILILLHHTALFYIEAFRLSEFFSTMGRTLLSAVFTLLLVIISQYLLFRKP